MAAELETGMFAREPAWHGLGVVIPEPVPSKEALILSGLDWTVELKKKYLGGDEIELSVNLPKGDGEWEDTVQTFTTQGEEVPDDFAVVRSSDGRILGKSVGRIYRPLQNVDAFRFLDSLVDEGDIVFESAGALGDGARVWMLARLDGEPYKVRGVDAIYPYLLATNSHNGQSAFRVFPTAVRVVCANTLQLALTRGRGSGISIQHSGDLQVKMAQAKNVFTQVKKSFDTFSEQAELMAGYELSDTDMVQFVETLFPAGKDDKVSRKTDKNRNAIYEELALQDGENTIHQLSGTAWDAFNAVTRWTNHSRTPKLNIGLPASKKKRAEFKNSSKYTSAAHEARLESLWFGSGDSLNQKALTYLLALSAGKDPQASLRA